MRVYILEDEANILQYIISLVDAIPYLKLVGYSVDITNGKSEILNLKPDLILSDIQLKDGNSLSLFHEIQIDAQIIFITAYNQFAIEALNIGALGYLLKPVDPIAFNQVIEKCYQKREHHRLQLQQATLAYHHYSGQQSPKKIALRSADVIDIVNVEDIIYCQGDKGYTTFVINNNNKILVSKIIKEFENLLPETLFFRCHQSYLINLTYLKKYFKEGMVEMSNGEIIPVSERKRSALLTLLDNF